MKRKVGENKLEKILYGAFFIVGVVILAIAIAVAIHTARFQKNAWKVQGVITRISSGTEVEFTLDGQNRTVWLSEYDSRQRVGDEVEVYVDHDNPDHVRMGATLYLPVFILCLIGVVFMSIGVVFLSILLAKRNKKKKLMQTGKRVYAEVTGGVVNYAYTVNGRHPYKLECCYTEEITGIKYLYRSGNIWIDPQLFVGQQVAVWVNPADLSKYYVDVDSLQQADNSIRDYR